jgi:hypothetical protein
VIRRNPSLRNSNNNNIKHRYFTIQASKIIATDLCSKGLLDADIGIGIVFGALIFGVARNLSLLKGRGQYLVTLY